MDSLSDVSEEPLEVDYTIYLKDEEGVDQAHVVETSLHTGGLFIAEEADPQGVQGGLGWKSFVFRVN